MSANVKEKGLSGLIKWLGALAAAISAILGLIFLVYPRLKPVAPEMPSPKVTLRNLQVRHWGKVPGANEVFGDCYHRVIIYFKARVEGCKGLSLPIYWDLENADPKIPYTSIFCGPVIGSNMPPRSEGKASSWRGNPGSPTSGFKPTTQDESFEGEIWVDTNYRGGAWRVRLEVTGPEGKLLGDADTEPFQIPQEPE